MTQHYRIRNAQDITRALRGVWRGYYGLANCPAYDDRLPSLSIRNGNDGRLLLYCYAGYSFRKIIQALIRIELLGHKAYDHTLSFSKQCCTDIKGAKQKTERAKAIWQQSQPINKTLAKTYLRMRGITCDFPPDLRFHSKCPHPSGITLPALVALVKGAGSFAIHRTFLKDNGCKTNLSPAKAMLGSVTGSAVHLSQSNDQHLVVCEGIETALALLSGLLSEPVNLWTSLSTHGMMRLNFSHNKARLTIAMDDDDAGRKAGFNLAKRAYSQGFEVFMMQAPKRTDFNDLLHFPR
ncbi:virulence-associated protein E [Bartonella henselae]|uniref:Virulence-associated protein E n=1 Tax=Bartonella henselae TaxID=38323 RepID=X5LZS4_BARHN|nr:toprim domain-containing protein [Bartonella henselae]MDM9997215.1 toprim domain-containing protein [Bartonella henselae]OLL49284.1 virulence-associated protein E [Bartonella henselae]OLL49448.1 virulence-associated protein E [Bartonella henselae]OLL50979.1 virulence-associated protein E [Bartonella henselae]OLL58350.1 virulence-associated protein E [Bartonella henselae]